MTGISFAFAWIGLRSESLWTGVFMHAIHNRFIQGTFPGLTTDLGRLDWFIDEFGAFTAVAAVIVAVVFWRKRGKLRVREPL